MREETSTKRFSRKRKCRGSFGRAFTFPANRTIVSETIDTTQENYQESNDLLIGKATKIVLPNHLYSSKVEAGSQPAKVRTVIDERGKVIWAEPISGHRLLFAGVHKAACNSVFKPTRLSGNPVKVTIALTYDPRCIDAGSLDNDATADILTDRTTDKFSSPVALDVSGSVAMGVA